VRVALFADSFDEANGVATLSREFAAFAEARQLPFCCVRAGTAARAICPDSSTPPSATPLTPPRTTAHSGPLATTLPAPMPLPTAATTLELKRGWASFPLDKDLYCDPLLSRYRNWIIDRLTAFRPDLIHITGPGDFGVLGFWVAHSLRIPLVASWHTNLHEYAAKRIQETLSFLPRRWRTGIARGAEELTLNAAMRFYRLPHFVLAPNPEMVEQLRRRTGHPAFLMAHGVDSTRFTPARRTKIKGPFTIGYVGRLTPEKNVEWFRELERSLLAAGERNFRLLLVGDGSEREWLKANLQFAELPGILRGDSVAAAYADMDVFVFPSRTDTFGLVLLEAMASGVPVVVSPETGARVEVPDGIAGFLSEDFAASVLRLMRDPALRQRMAAEARRFACSKSWAAVFEELDRTYEAGLASDEVRGRLKRTGRMGDFSMCK
jgi:phosphatidylinositol alpha 1,6-mannosyltransferase